MKPLHHSTSNIEVRSDLLHLAAMELEAMSISSSSSSSNNNASSNSHRHFDPYASSPSSSASNDYNNNNNNTEGSAVTTASTTSKQAATTRSSSNDDEPVIIEIERPFPPGCLHLLYSLPSNSSCHDCHSHPAHWASISYGITLCLQCSGKHRSLGVHTSVVKSVQLDSWKRREVLCMLEGGNEQLTRFFDRHEMGSRSRLGSSSSSTGRRQEDGEQHQRRRGLLDGSTNSPTTTTKTMEMKYYDDNNASSWVLDRYKTKAASFYRQHLMGHATRLSKEGVYGGREASRASGRGTTRNGGGARRESSRLAD